MNKTLLIFLAAFGLVLSGYCADTSVHLSSVSPASENQGWGILQIDKSVSGSALSIGGRKFEHGLGTHAVSEIVYDLEDLSATAFTAMVGADDALKDHPEVKKASMVFQVFVDGIKKFDSGVMHIGDQAKPVNVDLKGAGELKLVVNDAGDGNTCDHADWAEGVVEIQKSVVSSQNSESRYTVKAKGITVRLDK